jgi:hypothetical protein
MKIEIKCKHPSGESVCVDKRPDGACKPTRVYKILTISQILAILQVKLKIVKQLKARVVIMPFEAKTTPSNSYS